MISADCGDAGDFFRFAGAIGALAALSPLVPETTPSRNGANMTKTIKAPRTFTARSSKTASDVQSMLHDIATVLRLTEMVKHEMLREQAQVECRQPSMTRPAAHEPMAVLA